MTMLNSGQPVLIDNTDVLSFDNVSGSLLLTFWYAGFRLLLRNSLNCRWRIKPLTNSAR